MTTTQDTPDITGSPDEPVPTPEERARQDRIRAAAKRALAEAAERREAAKGLDLPREIDGRGGLEPVRYGDWEIKGLTVDF